MTTETHLTIEYYRWKKKALEKECERLAAELATVKAERDQANRYAESQRKRADSALQSLEHRTLSMGADIKKLEAELTRLRGLDKRVAYKGSLIP